MAQTQQKGVHFSLIRAQRGHSGTRVAEWDQGTSASATQGDAIINSGGGGSKQEVHVISFYWPGLEVV